MLESTKNCDRVLGRLHDLFEGTLEPSDQEEVLGHVADCDSCCEVANDARIGWEAVTGRLKRSTAVDSRSSIDFAIEAGRRILSREHSQAVEPIATLRLVPSGSNTWRVDDVEKVYPLARFDVDVDFGVQASPARASLVNRENPYFQFHRLGFSRAAGPETSIGQRTSGRLVFPDGRTESYELLERDEGFYLRIPGLTGDDHPSALLIVPRG